MMVVNYSAVRAYRDIYAGLLKIFVASGAYLYKSRCLTSAYAFGFARDTYRAAAYSDLNKICSGFCKEHKAVSVNNVSGADFNGVAVFFSDKPQCSCLPFAEAL